jgi:hypothetical protein
VSTPLPEILGDLPTEAGGVAIVLATSGTPPALALLSAGDVLVTAEGEVRCCVYATSSVVSRLGGAFTLLVPDETRMLRVEAVDARASVHGEVALVEGTLAGVRPTSEPPWRMSMGFEPDGPGDPRIAAFVEYWRAARAWLEDPASDPPEPPS